MITGEDIYIDGELFREITPYHVKDVKPGQYMNTQGVIYMPDSHLNDNFRMPVYGNSRYGRIAIYRLDGSILRTNAHRMIMIVFNPVDGFENLVVNHEDGNTRNNDFSNLEWTTTQGNNEHAFRTGLNPTGEKHHCAKLTEKEVNEICKILEGDRYYGEYRDLAKKYNVSSHVIESIAKGESWKKESSKFYIDYNASGINSKLTEEDVENICQELEKGRYHGQNTELAKKYNVCASTIKEIVAGRSFQHISSKYNIQKTINNKLSEDEVHKICKIIQDNKGLAKYDNDIYNIILSELHLENTPQLRHNIRRLVRRDQDCYYNITSQYQW